MHSTPDWHCDPVIETRVLGERPKRGGRLGAGRMLWLGRFITLYRRTVMNWVDPAFCDIRLGFEVTAYVYVR